ncbi:hypothetical protein PAXRUDRAFT_139640 [Paxillus rubicundulus Ve08.2h10]|uniref:WD40 repeat-like protein n=1 Tax=Paxillus rubicundulus Ve08.2h10 TaxID=930991 RepID=A0A0D0DZH2_9AGAM|nr:hypothetical protein PAXRUDRAFT_139640 [Paxillus rubicundulus Ve08.2h10]
MESGELIHVFEGHGDDVNSVYFSPDSTRVVSRSRDGTVWVWSVETGELAFEPIECHGRVYCVRYSPSRDRIASGADSVQIWNAETGVGILSIRGSSACSLAWTLNGTDIIGGGFGLVTIWNSDGGERLRMWNAHGGSIRGLSLSPTATQLATSNWWDKVAFVFDTSAGERTTSLKHDQQVQTIAFSRPGRVRRQQALVLVGSPRMRRPATLPRREL